MGKGRSPCCDKTQVKRGPWSPAEDLRLISFIQKYGHENWRALPRQAGLLRCGKSCRLRWINYLRPDVKRGNFTKEEEDSILRLHETLGNKWSRIAAHFPGRTDNEIKNVWNTHLKKRLGFKNAENSGDDQSKELSSITSSSSSSSSGTSFLSSAKPSNGGGDQYEHQSQDQESMAKINKPPEPTRLTIQAEQAQLDANKGLKELTSFSVSSYGSNNNGSSSTSSQVGINSMPEDDHQPMDLLFDFAGLYDIDPNKLQEVSDYDFWDMLDVFGASESNEVHFPDQPDLANYQSSNIGLVENENWLGYLENELGLDHQATTKTTDQTNQEFVTKDTTEQLVPETFHCDKFPKPAADQSHDQGMGCNFHQMWPSLPHNSAF